MRFPLRFITLCRGFALYLLWTWGAAALIVFIAHWLSRDRHAPAPKDLLLLATFLFPAGTFAAGAASYLGLQLGREGCATGEYYLAGRSAALMALGAEMISGLLFCGGMISYGALSDIHEHEGGAIVTAITLLTLGMLFISLLGSLIPCILGSIIGIAVGMRLRCRSNRQTDNDSAISAGSISVASRIAGFAALNVVGLLCVRLYGGLWVWFGATSLVINNLVLIRLLIGMLLSIVLLSNLWACLVGFWFMWLDRHTRASDWRTWLTVVPLLGLTMFGLWYSTTSFIGLGGY